MSSSRCFEFRSLPSPIRLLCNCNTGRRIKTLAIITTSSLYKNCEEGNQGAGMSSLLPEEIILNIFLRLQVKSLLRFRCVCKSWFTLIHDPIFIKNHLNRSIEKEKSSLVLREGYQFYSIDYDDTSPTRLCAKAVEIIHYPFKSQVYRVQILGSCNGLISIIVGEGFIYFWNPSTKEYKKIPTSPKQCSKSSYGFGYNCNIDDYKLVRVNYKSEVDVYTLGSDSWKSIQSIPYKLSFFGSRGVLVNGALHWIATPSIGSGYSTVIVAFDVDNERFEEVPQPEHMKVKKFYVRNVGVLGGCLSLCDCLSSVSVEVWVMKDYGVRESWRKVFNITQQKSSRFFNYLNPIKSFNNGLILLEKDNNGLILYDPKKAKKRILKIHGIPKWFTAETFVVESLVSLNSGTFVGARSNKGSTIPQEEAQKARQELVNSICTSLSL